MQKRPLRGGGSNIFLRDRRLSQYSREMEIYSLYGLTALVLLVAGGAMVFIALSYRRVPGFLSCGYGCLMLGMAMGTILLRLIIPGKAVIFASDVLLGISAKYFVDGMRIFRGKPRLSLSASLVLGTVFLSGIAYWLFLEERQSMRTALVSVLFAAVLFESGWIMIRQPPPKDRAIYWWMGSTFLLNSLCLLIRAYAAGFNFTSGRLFGEGPVELITLIAVNFGALVCGFGMLTASNMRFIREIEELALNDPLTQLPNRRFFEERFLEAGRRASRTGRRLALIYMDVDGFKQINDSLGHSAGDAVLKSVAQRIAAASRESDCVARLGGDEFVLLLEDAGDREELAALIDRLKEQVGQPIEIGNQAKRISVSCGLAVFPDDVKAVDELVHQADSSMYAAKRREPMLVPKRTENTPLNA